MRPKMWFVYRDGEFVYQCWGKDQALKFIRRRLSGKRWKESREYAWTYDYAVHPRKMTQKEALKHVMRDIMAMTPEQRRAELDKHRDSPFVKIMGELREFAASEFFPKLPRNTDVRTSQRSLRR